MKVLLPEGRKLEGFERHLQETLEQADLAGYALMGFKFAEAWNTNKLHEIDALVILRPGIFACLEAKGYRGTWEGNANTKWTSDGQEINSVKQNPYDQVNSYSLVIKNKLNQIHKSSNKPRPLLKKEKSNQNNSNNVEFYVNPLIIVPDEARIAIESAVVDAFQPVGTVLICHRSKLEQVLVQIPPRSGIEKKVAELGVKQIISKLIGISVEQISTLITPGSLPKRDIETLTPVPDKPKPEPITSAPSGKAGKEKGRLILRKLKLAAGIVATCGLLATTAVTAQYFWGNRPCESSIETRIQNICYKDLVKTPLRIGILSSPDQYASLKAYLKQQLGSKALDVVIEGNSDISYAEAQNKIAKREWDIVFALSPMNGMRAKDNSYIWLARMFPQFPLTYQAALYVKSNSLIQSINDIKSHTKIALGDFNSASGFYMPTYNLYGKSMTVTAGHRSSKIKDLVMSGIVDMGAGVYSTVKGNPQFRVIQVSREIPSSGVYLSPKISPNNQEQIRQILMNAPEAIKKAANYGEGPEPNYELFRAISLRADEVMGCADFARQPVQFFCKDHSGSQAQSASKTGTITGFTNAGNGMVRLRFEEKDGKVCQLLVALKTLSSIPNGTSPGMINRKRISLTGVKLEQSLNQACEGQITDPKQMIVL